MSLRKYPYPPHGGSLEIPQGWESQKPKFLKPSMKLNLNFGSGGEFKLTTFNLVNNIKKLNAKLHFSQQMNVPV